MNEAELLFSEILNCQRAELYLNRNSPLGKDNAGKISSALKRRISGEPIQYILGKSEFMGLEFKVKRGVFIPRPETEVLVETVLKIVPQCPSAPVPQLRILDIGTGSGCIAVSLAKLLSNFKITATDISLEALKIAQDNASLNNVSDNIRFIPADLFTQYASFGNTQDASRAQSRDAIRNTQYDVIVSNPPYIPTSEIDHLQSEISYEPRIALDGGEDGLEIFRKLILESPVHLKEGGFLIMEIGFNQCEDIKNIFQKYGNFKILEVVKDYNHIDRVIVAKKH